MSHKEKHTAHLVRVIFGIAVFFTLVIGFVKLSAMDDGSARIHDAIVFWDKGSAEAEGCESLVYYKTILRPGSINREVIALQELFICLGYLDEDYEVDAYMDESLLKVVNTFQEDHDLVVFRAVGRGMQKFLNENY